MNPDRITLLEKYIQEDPDDPFNTYALAMEYYESDPEKSAELLLELTMNHPDYLPTYFKAAHLLWEMENEEKTAELFKKGIELAKQQGDSKALQELSSAYHNFQFEIE